MPEISNRAREALYPSVREMFELASHVPDAISFAIGEPGFDTPRPMIDAAYRAALAGDTHYTPNRRAEALRRAWCDARERADGARGTGYVRLSYVGTREDTAEGLRRVHAWLEELAVSRR
ncbi:hypothetical protein [Bifidobacterium vespertilionis]|uniref:Aminotransferase class I/II-fold pyridoxal phosphate-dependent enzyme n=1 Tax=Bifidobacterium vespertilionis TaxID=2562524 RepID=A0A5J5DUL2_9BIFI|nr:hypothetical protein [Bifidobacterium vespertilionis]KAA8820076.1 hypothetical protein EMO90_07705 [Bifidobacterium vespertilionis]KAA8822231.1 hypothetical protein EM848_09415 [Bifidobacterium vespertilionis]